MDVSDGDKHAKVALVVVQVAPRVAAAEFTVKDQSGKALKADVAIGGTNLGTRRGRVELDWCAIAPDAFYPQLVRGATLRVLELAMVALSLVPSSRRWMVVSRPRRTSFHLVRLVLLDSVYRCANRRFVVQLLRRRHPTGAHGRGRRFSAFRWSNFSKMDRRESTRTARRCRKGLQSGSKRRQTTTDHPSG